MYELIDSIMIVNKNKFYFYFYSYLILIYKKIASICQYKREDYGGLV